MALKTTGSIIYASLDIFSTTLVLFTSMLLIWRRHKPPLASRNTWLLQLTILGFALRVGNFTNEKNTQYCGLWVLLDWVGINLFGIGAVLLGLQLVLKGRFERKKLSWIKRKITPELILEIKRERRLLSGWAFLGYFCILSLISAVGAVPAYVADGCTFASLYLQADYIYEMLEYAIIVFVIARKLRGVREAFGVKNDLAWAIKYIVPLTILEVILDVAVPSVSGLPDGDPFDRLFWLAHVIWVIHAVLRHALLTFAVVRRLYTRCTKTRLVPEGGDPSLADILSTELGSAYFAEHLRREYSEENLMCVKAIDAFSRKPTYAGMRDIIDRYVDPCGPLAVNICFTTRDAVLAKVANWQKHHEPSQYADAFLPIKASLMELLINDSLPRFRDSSLYDRFLANEPLPMSEMTSNGLFDTAGPNGSSLLSTGSAPAVSVHVQFVSSQQRSPTARGSAAIELKSTDHDRRSATDRDSDSLGFGVSASPDHRPRAGSTTSKPSKSPTSASATDPATSKTKSKSRERPNLMPKDSHTSQSPKTPLSAPLNLPGTPSTDHDHTPHRAHVHVDTDATQLLLPSSMATSTSTLVETLTTSTATPIPALPSLSAHVEPVS